MPHLVFEGDLDLESWVRDFEPVLLRSGADVLRADRIYLEREGRGVLIEALVVEAGRKMSFYVQISRHSDGSTTLRVDPLTHPERSPGLRELVTYLGRELLLRTPRAKVRSTNLVLPSDE